MACRVDLKFYWHRLQHGLMPFYDNKNGQLFEVNHQNMNRCLCEKNQTLKVHFLLCSKNYRFEILNTFFARGWWCDWVTFCGKLVDDLVLKDWKSLIEKVKVGAIIFLFCVRVWTKLIVISLMKNLKKYVYTCVCEIEFRNHGVPYLRALKSVDNILQF